MAAEVQETAPVSVPEEAPAAPDKKPTAASKRAKPAGSPAKKRSGKKKNQPGKYSQLVVETIRKLGERSGSSLAKIYNEAKKVSWFDQQNGRTYLRYSIKALVQNDSLIRVKGTGANGSFKLNKKKLDKPADRRGAGAAKSPAAAAKKAKKPPEKKAKAKPSPKKKPPQQQPKAPGAAKKAAKPAKKTAKPAKKTAKPVKKPKKASKPGVPKVPKAKRA